MTSYVIEAWGPYDNRADKPSTVIPIPYDKEGFWSLVYALQACGFHVEVFKLTREMVLGDPTGSPQEGS